MGLRFSFPIELRIDLTSLPQGWKEEVVPFLLEQSITYEGATNSKALQSVSVNVRLNDGKRTIASSSSGYQPTPTFSAKRKKVVHRKQYANSSKEHPTQELGKLLKLYQVVTRET
jgi:hypothetical protein